MAEETEPIVDLEAFHRKLDSICVCHGPESCANHVILFMLWQIRIFPTLKRLATVEELLNSVNSVRRMVVSWLPQSNDLERFKEYDDANVNLDSLRTRPDRYVTLGRL